MEGPPGSPSPNCLYAQDSSLAGLDDERRVTRRACAAKFFELSLFRVNLVDHLPGATGVLIWPCFGSPRWRAKCRVKARSPML